MPFVTIPRRSRSTLGTAITAPWGRLRRRHIHELAAIAPSKAGRRCGGQGPSRRLGRLASLGGLLRRARPDLSALDPSRDGRVLSVLWSCPGRLRHGRSSGGRSPPAQRRWMAVSRRRTARQRERTCGPLRRICVRDPAWIAARRPGNGVAQPLVELRLGTDRHLPSTALPDRSAPDTAVAADCLGSRGGPRRHLHGGRHHTGTDG
jgi:hypothetical protein